MSVTINYEVEIYSCNKCGILYGFPQNIKNVAECPKCLRQQLNEANGTNNERWDEIKKLEKQIASFKGYIKSKRKGKK